MTSWLAIAIGLWVGVGPSGPSPWGAAYAGPLERCAQALAALGAQVRALPDGADAAPFSGAIRRLLADPCFTLARREGGFTKTRSALALREWWTRGGEAWLRSQLEPPARRQVILPPTMRKALTRESAPGHALEPLLCGAAEAACGAETIAWVRRAEAAFASHAEGEARRRAAPGTAGCTKESARYPEWRACVDEASAKEEALPLGRFRAPAHGWLVVRGRRGHYSWCEEVRAYDLASGAAWIAATCGGFFQQGRKERLESGIIPLEALREAAWAILFARETQRRVRREALPFDLPTGLVPRLSETTFHGMGFSVWVSSAQTQLEWSWQGGGKVVASGKLTWPNASLAGDTHAAERIRHAEAQLRPGCAAAAPPPVDERLSAFAARDCRP